MDRETLHMLFKYAGKLGVVSKNPIDAIPESKEKKAIVDARSAARTDLSYFAFGR
jgi:hypothetical protein